MQKQEVLRITLADLYSEIGASENGLTEKDAAARLAVSGPNTLKRKGVNALSVLGRQFKNSLIYLLIVASILAYGIQDFQDGTIILIILLINTSLGFYQEYRSEKIIEKLSHLITKQVRVKRDRQISLIDESRIVPGDILIVREGDIAPADMRLIETENLQINESQLTGESVPVMKRAIPEANAAPDTLLFTGSIVEKGEGVGVVYATGNDTELGTIAKLSTETKKQTQYEKFLNSFSSFLMRIVLIGLAFVFIAKFFLSRGNSNPTALLLFVIALAVGTVPEVLPVIATVTLSTGALKLTRQHVIVRRLSAMEDFGNINLLCTDKTGTITENKMVVKHITSTDERLLQIFAYAGVTLLKGRKKRAQNSYDDAFLHHISEDIKKEAQRFKVLKELPFDPEDRRSRFVIKDGTRSKYYLLSIGAPETLLAISSGEHGKYLHDIATEGRRGLHHLAMAYKEISYANDFDILKNEHGLTFLGYVSLEDPLRSSAKKTIEHAEYLGIKIKILTGDSKEVAEYVGRQVGLIKDGDTVYLGSELEAMPEHEFKALIQHSSVFARVSPTQKFNIIKALKETNVVGYQGDGINDAPALKLADVAIAVNSATDIAKENADIVLLNKSLEVIVNGIKYGRSIFVNINKYIRYTMSNNFGSFVGLSVLYLFSVNLPILPVQMLLNNLIGDIPLIMIATDTVEDDEVVQPEKHNIRELMFVSLVIGIPTALFEILYFAMIKSQPAMVVQTSLYVFLTFQALIIFYAIRNKKHFWKVKASSAALNISFLLAFMVSLGIIFVPQFQTWFSFAPISAAAIGVILILMLLYFIVVDYVKVWYYQSSLLTGSYVESATTRTAATNTYFERRSDKRRDE